MGRHLYSLREYVDRANSQINSKEYELQEIDEEIREKEAALIARETTTEERILILADLKDLSERTGTLATEIEHLYDERARSQVELENYQASLVGYGY